MHQSAEANDNPAKQHRTSPLCWAARLLALVYGLLIALFMFGVWMLALIGHLSRGETKLAMLGFLSLLPFFVPLILAVIAWRWHFVGGTLIILGSAAVYLCLIIGGDMQWGIHLYMVPLLAGGLLHLLAWHKEKRSDQVPQPM